jgi:hypothetical protein
MSSMARLKAGGAEVALNGDTVASIAAALPWSLRADAQSAVLITFAWTEGAGQRS